MNPFRSLAAKLTVSFLLLIVAVSFLTFSYTYGEAKRSLQNAMKEELKGVAAVMASQVDGNTVANLKPGDESSREYQSLREKLLAMRLAYADIRFSYIMRQANDGSLEFAVDDSYGIEADAAEIGEPYVSEDSALAEEDKNEIVSGLVGPSTSSRLYTDRWGTFMSGYAPIKNSKGEAVAVLGVDMTAKHYLEKQEAVGTTVYVIIAVAIMASVLIVAGFANALSRDIDEINQAAKRVMIEGVHRASNVKRADEIGELSKSIDQMIDVMKVTIRK